MSLNTEHLRRALKNHPSVTKYDYLATTDRHVDLYDYLVSRQNALRVGSPVRDAIYWTTLVVAMIVLLTMWATFAWAADGCPGRPRLGAPTLSGPRHLTDVCHAGYEAMVDDDARIPLWVAYELEAPHALGCLPRKNNFHPDPQLLAGSARPADYAKTGYDKGHQAPAEDFAWSKDELSDSFSMANMAPQKPGLNRQQWERLEETVRAWALQRGSLTVYVGPVVNPGDKTISRGRVVVPDGFWKVVVDNATGQSLRFYMDNKTTPKGDLVPFLAPDMTPQDVRLPLPTPSETRLWSADLGVLRKARSKACAK